MRLLRDGGVRSRSDLARVTGMSPTTISKTVQGLRDLGWLEETDDRSDGTRMGRPAIGLHQRSDALSVCGVQLGVGLARVGLADVFGRVRSARSVSFDVSASPDEVLATVGQLARSVLSSLQGPPCLAVGVAAPGPVDPHHRVNLLALNLGWRNVPVADRLEDALGLPVFVDHNVRAMALSEARYGGHGTSMLAYVYIRTGVGLGLVLNGEPFAGGSHGVSELGHIRVQEDGRECVCGARGCLETLASEPYLTSRLQALGVDVPGTPDPRLLTLLDARRRDPGVDELRSALIRHLASGLATVVNLLSPRLIVLGGALADAPQSFIDDLHAALEAEVFPLLRPELRLARPQVPEPGVAAGAAVALEFSVYASPS